MRLPTAPKESRCWAAAQEPHDRCCATLIGNRCQAHPAATDANRAKRGKEKANLDYQRQHDAGQKLLVFSAAPPPKRKTLLYHKMFIRAIVGFPSDTAGALVAASLLKRYI